MPKVNKFSFLLLCFGSFNNWLSYGIVYPIFAGTLFLQDPLFLGGTSDLVRSIWLGVLLSASPIGQFFAAPFMGALADRHGRGPILQLSFLIIFLGYLLSAGGIWGHSLWIVVLGRIVTGVGAGNAAAINSSIADISTSSSSKAKNFALIAMFNGAGFSIGPFIGGTLSTLGFSIPFVLAGVLSLITCLLFRYAFQETLISNKNEQADFHLKNMFHLLVSKKLKVLFPTFFIFCIGWSFYWEFIPVTWIREYNLGVLQIGNFYAYGSAVYLLSSGVLVRLIANRLKQLKTLMGAWALLAICLLLLIHADIKWYWAGIALQQFLVSVIFPVGTAMVSDAVSKHRQGEVLGAFQSLQSLAFAFTPFLGGVLLDFSLQIPLILSGATIGLAAILSFLFLNGRSKKNLKENT